MGTLKTFTVKPIDFPQFELCLYGSCFAVAGALYLIPHIFPHQIGTVYIILSFLMTVISVLFWQNPKISSRRALTISIILCVFLLPLAPLTSNDSERYLWDGTVFLSGFDPYISAPNDPTLSELRMLWPTPEEHADYATLYPPGALTIFSICALAGPVFGVWLWKGLLTLSACLSLILMYKLLEDRGGVKAFSLFAFSPLFLFEAQAGAHLDIICVLGIIAALYAIEKDMIIPAGILIGLAATVKFLPAVMVGPFLFYLKPRLAMQLCVSSALTWIGIYGLMFGLGYKPLGLLPTFFEKWRGGAPLYPLLESLQMSLEFSKSQFLYLLAVLAITGFALSAWLAKKGRLEIALALSLAIPLLLSPVLFPWYLLMLLPLWVLKPNMTLFAAITLAPLSYGVLNQWLFAGIWAPAMWPAYVLLGGILWALIFDITRLKYFSADA